MTPLLPSREVSRVFIDGDIIAYRMAAAADSKGYALEEAVANVDGMVEQILHSVFHFPTMDCYDLFLTGPSNFRYDIAKVAPYKGNRATRPRPVFLPSLREHLVDNWGAVVSEGEEADDMIAKAVTQEGPNSCVASIDKDFYQLNCWHYNFIRQTWRYVEEFEGLSFFYQQILMGDAADNIIGLDGVGPVKAQKRLEGCATEQDLYEACVKAYDGELNRVVENGRLLWLRREPEQLWEPPNG